MTWDEMTQVAASAILDLFGKIPEVSRIEIFITSNTGVTKVARNRPADGADPAQAASPEAKK